MSHPESRHIAVWVAAQPDVVYDLAADPATWPRWAAGLAQGGLRQGPQGWVADSPMGEVAVEFSPPNEFGVLDHVVRVNETIDGLREVLSFAFEAAHLLESSRQGEVSRKFAGWAAILAVPTAIAGIYGMNFDTMPELHWQYGYFMALAMIFGAAGLLFWRFRRSGWI